MISYHIIFGVKINPYTANIQVEPRRALFGSFEERHPFLLDLSLKSSFNQTLANCSDLAMPCSNPGALPIVIGSLVTYAFDKRRFNFTSPQFTTSIKESEESKNDHNEQPRLTQMVELTAKRLILEYFHNHNLDKLKYDILTEDGSVETIVEHITQGINSGQFKSTKFNPNLFIILSDDVLQLFFQKKFNRCPESYPINTGGFF